MLLFSLNPLMLARQEWTAAVTYYGEMTRDEEERKSSLRDKSSLSLAVLLSAASSTRPVCLPEEDDLTELLSTYTHHHLRASHK